MALDKPGWDVCSAWAAQSKVQLLTHGLAQVPELLEIHGNQYIDGYTLDASRFHNLMSHLVTRSVFVHIIEWSNEMQHMSHAEANARSFVGRLP